MKQQAKNRGKEKGTNKNGKKSKKQGKNSKENKNGKKQNEKKKEKDRQKSKQQNKHKNKNERGGQQQQDQFNNQAAQQNQNNQNKSIRDQLLDEIKKFEKENTEEINNFILKCDINLVQQLLLNEDQLKVKINEAKFIINSEKEKNREKDEDEQKEELPIIHKETRRMDGMIENMSDSSGENERDRSKVKHDPPILEAPNINGSSPNGTDEEVQDDDVHNKEELVKRVNELKEKTKEKIVGNVDNEMYIKDNPVLDNL